MGGKEGINNVAFCRIRHVVRRSVILEICFNQRFSSQVEQGRGVERVAGEVGWYAANPDMSAVMYHIKSLKVLLQRQRQTMPDSCPERVQLPFSLPFPLPTATCSRVYCQMVIILLIDFETAPA